MNKKGSMFDVLIIPVFIFLAAIMFIFGFYLNAQVQPLLVSESGNDTYVNATATNVLESTNIYDYVVFGYAMALLISLILTMFYINTHPAFFWVFFLVIMVATVIAVPLSNSYTNFETELGVASSFTVTHVVMENLPIWTFLFGCAAAVALYAKSRYATMRGGFFG